ncbi:hypothetical protein NLJ89_g9586 [Agrocybe chaxingu]|uniref:Hydrophobin n=1 Tax=Agrocybe chaxingu TaxID=84603 RepID=A0A9W8JSS3_9AGAR|nr:hypothetical protein NLJ89_g9586 [Agrocybe chaxingu]
MRFHLALAPLALTTLAAATNTVTVTVTTTAYPPNETKPASQCNVGDLHCCNTTAIASNPVAGILLGLLQVAVEPITALIGITCSPILAPITSNSCSAQPVCCQNNNFNGVIVVGCSPVNLSL